ncbi:MAG: flavodoxin [Ruminococcus sp.]|uniref:flavodoxin domain-containing protein n=1 Tax=Ruminococcus sp. TaxID=41978 RepID=UPI001B2EC679|nr:flavodoxin domain-containing protein [Ruminococcus sp.]MBO7475154.1 flavodoxin [Ruminococcus sp.]
MKAIVAYKSKSGYTKTYADWIAQELGCEIKENAELSDIISYDTIIYGGGMYAGGFNGVKLITKNLDKLSEKKIVLFAVGSNPGRKHEMQPFWDKVLTAEQQKHIGHFYLRGGFDFSKLTAGDKILMKMLKVRLQKLKERTEDEQGLLDAYDTPVDFRDKDNIKPLIEYILK